MLEFTHGRHTHTLATHNALQPYVCNGCKMPGLNPCFKCLDEVCHLYLHKHCFAAEQLHTIRHRLLDCDLDYYPTPPEVSDDGDVPYCDACGLDIKGFRYRCFTESHAQNRHDLHPTCANLEREMDWDGLKLELRDKVESKCLHCNERYPTEECIGFTGWKWVAKKRLWGFPNCFSGRKICFHVKCMNEIMAPGGYKRKKLLENDSNSRNWKEQVSWAIEQFLDFFVNLMC